MTMTALLDFDLLLKPIKKSQPTGIDIRQDETLLPLYHKLKDARMSARTIERQLIQGAAKPAKADWETVYELAVKLLAKHTKDLEITAWLIEALLRKFEFAGLSAGFTLAHKLIERYWDDIYPLPDEDGNITRAVPFTGLNGDETEGTLIAPIALVPLTQGSSNGPFALWQYEQAVQLLKITDSDKRSQRIANGAVTLELIETAVKETSTEFLQTKINDLEQCIQDYQVLVNTLALKCGPEAPPSSRILTRLIACVDCLRAITSDKFALAKEAISQNSENNSLAIPDTSYHGIANTNLFISNNVLTREKVLQSLLEAANFFRQTEPHSPLPYILERTVKWGKMPFPDLLKELIKDEQTIKQLEDSTGILLNK